MRFYVVIDTNVLISAMLNADSVPGLVVQFALDGLLIPVLNEKIVNEYREVLSRPKFRFSERSIKEVIEQFKLKGVFVDAEKSGVDLPDPDDIVFYEVVMEERKGEDAYLVTGNIKHFPTRPFIVTPRQMLDVILGAADCGEPN